MSELTEINKNDVNYLYAQKQLLIAEREKLSCDIKIDCICGKMQCLKYEFTESELTHLNEKIFQLKSKQIESNYDILIHKQILKNINNSESNDINDNMPRDKMIEMIDTNEKYLRAKSQFLIATREHRFIDYKTHNINMKLKELSQQN